MRVSSTVRVPWLAGAVLALAAVVPAPAVAGAEARALLADMTETMRTGAYEGTIVYQQGASIDSMSLVHGWVDGKEHERLVTQTGEPFELIRAGEVVTCVWPEDQRALVSARTGRVSPLRSLTELSELPEVYRARLAGDGRAAGRTARIVEILSRDDLRYSYRMWIDPGSRLLLRSDLVAPDGRVLERILFTEIRQLEQVTLSRFAPSLEGVEYTRHPDPGGDGSEVERPAWVASELPAGFRAVSHARRELSPGGEVVQQSVYSDGLASVSVFIEPPGEDTAPLEGVSRMGAVHAFGRSVDGHRVTVVGEVPGTTVRAIAEAVRRGDDG
ncbi:MAG: MucB/RseB C-terminal domain-containing protein [Halofilum sp. (in: g-proteobacteria)]|nr:MucB/RseB C-terminal domain-containing protein [Halofilum sp. (in: g-proteobacteria)]